MKPLTRPLTDGILTGLFLQLALGPVFFYILGITMDADYISIFFAVLAVTLADYIYIFLSLMGVGKLLGQERAKKALGLVSAVILIFFGTLVVYKGIITVGEGGSQVGTWTPVKSFTSCFVLTLSSPLTILFWGSVLSAKAMEKKYASSQLILFGLGAGGATFGFLSGTMVVLSIIKSGIPPVMVQILNTLVGLVLVYYGIVKILRH